MCEAGCRFYAAVALTCMHVYSLGTLPDCNNRDSCKQYSNVKTTAGTLDVEAIVSRFPTYCVKAICISTAGLAQFP